LRTRVRQRQQTRLLEDEEAVDDVLLVPLDRQLYLVVEAGPGVGVDDGVEHRGLDVQVRGVLQREQRDHVLVVRPALARLLVQPRRVRNLLVAPPWRGVTTPS